MPWISTTGGPLPAIRYITRWPWSSISQASKIGSSGVPAVPWLVLTMPSRNAGHCGFSFGEIFLVGLPVRRRILLGRVETERIATRYAVRVLIAVAGVLDQLLLGELEALRLALARFDQRLERGVRLVVWALRPFRRHQLISRGRVDDAR